MNMMEEVGTDGISRGLDEHYNQPSDVSADPYGAWQAIQNLWLERERLLSLIDRVKNYE